MTTVRNKRRTFMCDFETTVYEGQEHTEVWAAAMTELFDETDTVEIFHSLPEMFDYMQSLKCSMRCYFHNLKFDGAFWLSFLMKDLGYTLALDGPTDNQNIPQWLKDWNMPEKSFKCAISAMGMWYSITIKCNNKIIEIRDSLKLLPFSVKRIGKSFKTKHKKLDMEYTGFRYAGCEITEEERKYIANDVLVVKEALEFMFTQGHNKLTIGACCLSEFKESEYNVVSDTSEILKGKGDSKEYARMFPNLYEFEIDKEVYGAANADAYIRKSYRGGWCYLVKGKEKRRFHNGTTADVNSLYPSMMSSESGNYYPVGDPRFVSCKGMTDVQALHILDLTTRERKYYFIRIKTRFYLKPGKLPFIQIKNSLRYACNECLESSDYYDKKDGKYYTHYWVSTGEDTMKLTDTRVELTLTMTDFKLFKEHYDLIDFEVLDFCYFHTEIGIFDSYIDRYKKLKQESTGAMRELAKLFLNNLYGKMASSTDSNFKIPFLKPDGAVGFTEVHANDKKPGYIPIGSAITSYARNFTIRAAQKNYHGVDNPGFIYADTDSIHCDLTPEQIVGITAHDTAFCCWKLEAQWDVAWFTRQKTYIEHVTHENLVPVETPYYNMKCAGMPERCKGPFIKSLERWTPEAELGKPESERYIPTEDEQAVIDKKYNLEDFTIGLVLPGKLMPKRIPGGVLLVDTTYEMR